jgi:hypothetical protein
MLRSSARYRLTQVVLVHKRTSPKTSPSCQQLMLLLLQVMPFFALQPSACCQHGGAPDWPTGIHAFLQVRMLPACVGSGLAYWNSCLFFGGILADANHALYISTHMSAYWQLGAVAPCSRMLFMAFWIVQSTCQLRLQERLGRA